MSPIGAGNEQVSIVRLDAFSIDRIVDALAERLAERGIASSVMTAEEVATRYRVSVGWVYAHKRDLGAEPLGTGPKPRWRFSTAGVEAYFTAGALDREQPGAPASLDRPRRAVEGPVDLLPIRRRSV